MAKKEGKKKPETVEEKFREIVDKKAISVLSKKIPAPVTLNKKIVEHKTTQLALSEMNRFREAFNRPPTKEELDKIAEAVYRQIKEEAKKDEKKKSRPPHRGGHKSFLEMRKKRRHRGHQPQEKGAKKGEKKIGSQSRRELLRKKRLERKKQKDGPQEEEEEPEMLSAQQSAVVPSNLSVSDLFSQEKGSQSPSVQDIVSDAEFGSLEKELEGLGGETDSVSKETGTGKSRCPNCKAFTQDLVFCPQCGTAFCSHCEKKVERLGGQAKITCPKCKTAFKSKAL